MTDAEKGIRVTVEDLSTGETQTRVVWDDYFLLTAGSAYLSSYDAYPTSGTVILRVKGVRHD